MDIYMKTKSGQTGRVIDIMNDDEILILLEFEEDGDIEWFAASDLAKCDHAEVK